MEYALSFEIIDGYEIVFNAGERTFDPQETTNYINKNYPNATENELKELYSKNKKYAPLQKNEKSISLNECEIFKKKIESLNENEMLLTNGSIINDLRKKEYWIKLKGRWEKEIIEKLGDKLPVDAILVDDLSKEENQEQHKMIMNQHEEDRLSSLTPEKKEEELQCRLDALADEADRLDKRNKIQGNEFDPIAWYNKGKQELLGKYKISEIKK